MVGSSWGVAWMRWSPSNSSVVRNALGEVDRNRNRFMVGFG